MMSTHDRLHRPMTLPEIEARILELQKRRRENADNGFCDWSSEEEITVLLRCRKEARKNG